MRKDDLEILLIIVSTILGIGGAISWWLSKFLKDKVDITILQQNDKNMKEDIEDLEERVAKLERRR